MGIEVFPVPASGPSLAEITSAITTNAAPASVTMPAITSSITTNAAPASVTMAAITSSITTNAPGIETWEQISEYKSSTGATNIDFTSIPQTYRKLVLVALAIELTSSGTLRGRINADSTASTYNVIHQNFAGGLCNSYLSQNNFQIAFQQVGAGSTTNCILEFPNYTSTASKYYTITSSFANTFYMVGNGTYRTGTTTNAITSLRLYTDTANNLFFSSNPGPSAVLYGVK